MRASVVLASAASLFMASPALAQDAQPAPSTDPPEAPAAAAPVAPPDDPRPAPANEKPAPEAEAVRSEGMRLGLELGFWRATGEDDGRINAGSPSLIPIGADVSWRTSKKVLLGLHGHAGLASRDDCLGDTECSGRGYGLGAHVEVAFGSSRTFVPYFRYGVGWQMLHLMSAYRNAEAYRYRHAIDLLDVRFGGDFVLARGAGGRTTRLGPFAGMNVGYALAEVTSFGGREADLGGHVWFVIGARGTTDW